MFIEVPYSDKTSPALKNVWLRACADVSQSYKCAAIDKQRDARPLNRIVQLTHTPALF